MKEKIHPKYYDNAKVQCACGNKFTIGSTMEKINIEICSKCHPFYTGAKKIMETGRVKKFEQKAAKAAGIITRSKKEKMAAKREKKLAKGK